MKFLRILMEKRCIREKDDHKCYRVVQEILTRGFIIIFTQGCSQDLMAERMKLCMSGWAGRMLTGGTAPASSQPANQ
jgi:hypothetical protein